MYLLSTVQQSFLKLYPKRGEKSKIGNIINLPHYHKIKYKLREVYKILINIEIK